MCVKSRSFVNFHLKNESDRYYDRSRVCFEPLLLDQWFIILKMPIGKPAT